MGHVVYGRQLGRQLGVPTANIPLNRYQAPLDGVFAVTVTGLDRAYDGIANVGIRPTIGGKEPLLEAHLFDFSGDIYGRRLTVTFRHKLRDERQFDSLDALKQQIARDIAQARAWFEGAAWLSGGLHSPAWTWILDRVTKDVVTRVLALGEEVPVLPVFSWIRAHNEGAAFSFLADQSGWQRWVLVALAIAFSTYLVVEIRRLPATERLLGWAYGLVLGGALGNLWDRALHGYVVDFALAHWNGSLLPHIQCCGLCDFDRRGVVDLLDVARRTSRAAPPERSESTI